MKIVITNVYCYQNKGDAGIVISMIEQLRTIYHNAEITIVSLYPELDNGKYKDAYVISSPILPMQYSNKIERLSNNLKGFFGMIGRIKTRKYKDFEEALVNADIIISCGGGFLQCRTVKYFLGDFILHYAQLYASKVLKKNYVIFAQTIGPFDNRIKPLMRPLLNNARLVLAREEISFNYMKRFFPESHTYLTGDIAFLLKTEMVDINIDRNIVNIGVTVRDWNFPNSIDKELMYKKYIGAITSFMDKWGISGKYAFYLMPQVIGPQKDNDITVGREIYNELKNKSSVYLLEKDYTPGQVKQIYSMMDYFIGTRMHSNIFALSCNVPCIAISYDYKTDGIMKMIHKEEYVISIDDITLELLDERFKKLVNDNSYKDELKIVIPEVIEKSKYNIELLKSIKV